MIKEVKNKIETAIQKHLANGGKLKQGSFGLDRLSKTGRYQCKINNSCCGLSCLIINTLCDSSKDMLDVVVESFGYSSMMNFQLFGPENELLKAFINGFDDFKVFELKHIPGVYLAEMREFGKAMWFQYGI